MSRYSNTYERKLIVSAKDALAIIINDRCNNTLATIDGLKYKPHSSRYDLYINKGLKCSNCGIEGNVGIFERHKKCDKWHWNFYYKKQNIETMITRDHILPISVGGSDNLSNCQPMCIRCNRKKGNGKVAEASNISFNIANQLSKDMINNLINNSLTKNNIKLYDQNFKLNEFVEILTDNIFNYISQGHNEIPNSEKWKKMKKRLLNAHVKNKKMADTIKILSEQIK